MQASEKEQEIVADLLPGRGGYDERHGLAAIKRYGGACQVSELRLAKSDDRLSDVLFAFSDAPQRNGSEKGLGLLRIVLDPALEARALGMRCN